MEKKKYNIMFCWRGPINPSRGGVERVTDLVTSELVRRGHKVYWLTDSACKYKYGELYEPRGVQLLELPWLLQKRKGAYEYSQLLQQHNIHFVVDQTGPTYYPWITQQPYICDGWPKFINVAHNDPVPYGMSEEGKERHKQGLLYSTQFYDALGLLSDAYRQKVAAWEERNMQCELVTLKNPCKYLGYRFLIPAVKTNTLLYVGRFDKDKNPMRLIEVWKHLYCRHPDWSFVLVGDGAYKNEMLAAAKGLPRIHFKGWESDPVGYYRSARISLLTSDREGLPMAMLEAMSLRCVPVVFDAFDSLNDVLPEDARSQLTVQPYDIQLMAQRISSLMENSGTRQEITNICYNHVRKNYSLDAVVDDWERLFAKLAGEEQTA